jgi:predicted short-subunit dehydrogenase-like oxidoreductase (DUF2520 family)
MKITIIGSGNVATHLALTFKNTGIKILQVYSRKLSNAEALAKVVGAASTSNLNNINCSADFYIIAVSDNAISEVVTTMPLVAGIVVHTAGCIPISVLDKFSMFGSMYPLQTFTKETIINFKKIPLFIEGNSKITEQKIYETASLLSNHIECADIEKRSTLHLAATFSCNFVNHLYTISQSILEGANLSFDYIKPLIEETARKACEINPYNAQTGPAKRNDDQIMNFHLKKLGNKDKMSVLYNLISESIINTYNSD